MPDVGRADHMFDLLAPGILLRHAWPHLLAIGVLVMLVALGERSRTNRRLALALPSLLFVLVLSYWTIENFINVGDWLGCVVSCIAFLGLMGGASYVTHRARCSRSTQSAAVIVGGIVGTGLTPFIWLGIACHFGGDCI